MLTASFVRMTAAFEFDLVRGAGERGVHAVPDLLQLEERLLVRGRVSVHAAADLVRVERVDGGGGDTESVRAPGDGSTWQASSTVRVVATDPLTAMLGMIHEDGAPPHGGARTHRHGVAREGPGVMCRSALIRSDPTRRISDPPPADAIRSIRGTHPCMSCRNTEESRTAVSSHHALIVQSHERSRRAQFAC